MATVVDEGAIEVFESTFVGGTRSIEAAEGGGRNAEPLVGRGGGGMELNVGGFRRGGSIMDGTVVVRFAGSIACPFGCGGCVEDGTSSLNTSTEGVTGLASVLFAGVGFCFFSGLWAGF